MGTSSGFDRSRLIALLKRDALRLGRFTLASGRESHYYVDGRKVTLSAEGAAVIGQGVLDVLGNLPEVTAIGVTWGYHVHAQLLDAGAHDIAHSFEELSRHIEDKHAGAGSPGRAAKET